MATILLVGHGSRDPEGVAEFLRFAADLQSGYEEHSVVPCFLEFARPSILEAVSQVVATRAERVIVMPLFLFAARHMREDIAGAIGRAQARYPFLPIYPAKHLGLDHRLLTILQDRIAEATSKAPKRLDDEIAVLLVGRGSRRPEGNAGVYEMADRLRAARAGHKGEVEVCFAGLARPCVSEAIRQLVKRGAQRIVVLPYLLFAGVLNKRIAAAVTETAAEFPDAELLDAGNLGGHPQLVHVVRDRVAAAQATAMAKGIMNDVEWQKALGL